MSVCVHVCESAQVCVCVCVWRGVAGDVEGHYVPTTGICDISAEDPTTSVLRAVESSAPVCACRHSVFHWSMLGGGAWVSEQVREESG